jgi:hypothetical protein
VNAEHELRRGLRSGAESEAGIHAHRDPIGRRLAPARADPQRSPTSTERIAPGCCAPSPRRRFQRSSTAASQPARRTGPRRAATCRGRAAGRLARTRWGWADRGPSIDTDCAPASSSASLMASAAPASTCSVSARHGITSSSSVPGRASARGSGSTRRRA